jgi:hypothetical protein
MFAKDPMTLHNSLKITAQETLLKAFSTLAYIMAQSRCKSKKAQKDGLTSFKS